MWIIITLFAASFQIARTSEQHRLRAILNTAEAGYVRFVYAFPVALTVTTIWLLGPAEIPDTSPRFWLGITGGGIAQILGTLALLQAFKARNFAVGTIYAKTEVLFVGAGSAIILGEPLNLLGWLGVLVCLIGVTWLALSKADTTTKLTSTKLTALDPAAMFGVLAAIGFSLAAIGIRAASTSLEGSVAGRALFTLTAMLGIQTLIQGAVLARSSTSSLTKVGRAWKPAVIVAALSLCGSFSWATAMTLESAAKVRTLGQVEIVLAFMISIAVHHETHRRSEYLASALTTAGIVLLVLS